MCTFYYSSTYVQIQIVCDIQFVVQCASSNYIMHTFYSTRKYNIRIGFNHILYNEGYKRFNNQPRFEPICRVLLSVVAMSLKNASHEIKENTQRRFKLACMSFSTECTYF